MGEINIPSALGMGFNFPLWAFLLRLGKLIIYIPIPGGDVEGIVYMAVCVRVCMKFDVYVTKRERAQLTTPSPEQQFVAAIQLLLS